MAIQIPQGYIVSAPEAIDNRLILTKAQMRELSRDENLGKLPDSYFCLCVEPEGPEYYRFYTYNRHNSYDYENPNGTGRYRPFDGGGAVVLPAAGLGIDKAKYEDVNPVLQLAINPNLVFDNEGKVAISPAIINLLSNLNSGLDEEIIRAKFAEASIKAYADSELADLRIYVNANDDDLRDRINDADAAILSLRTYTDDKFVQADLHLDSEIGILDARKQDKLTAGRGITLTGNTLSAKIDEDTLKFNTAQKVYVDIKAALPSVSGQGGKALTVTSEGNLTWGEASKLDNIALTDSTVTKVLPIVNKKVTIPVSDGLAITPTGTIVHVNEVTAFTVPAASIYVPKGIDTQGHITDGNDSEASDALREVLFLGKESTTNAWVELQSAIIGGQEVTKASLKIAGYNPALTDKYRDATLKLDINGLAVNLKPAQQRLLPTDTSEGFIVLNGNEVGISPSLLNRFELVDFKKGVIDSEGLGDSRYYPNIQLLDAQLALKQDLMTNEYPIIITSEDEIQLLYDTDTLAVNAAHKLYAKNVSLPVQGKLTGLLTSQTSEGNKLVDTDYMIDSIASNLGTFRGNYDSEGQLEATWPYDSEGAQKNDYAFITTEVITSEGARYYYDRYKCVYTPGGNNWDFEYRVSGSTFTANQLKALNSNWTAPLTNLTVAHLNDTTIHITSEDRIKWDKVPDWEQETSTEPDFIKHRPAIKRDSSSSALSPDRNTGVKIGNVSTNVASGAYSVAEGTGTQATAQAAHAEGNGAVASGPSSHAEGYQTTASDDYAHAEGYRSTAAGDDSHAEGYQTSAEGANSHAEGLGSQATAAEAHAEGSGTIASGHSAHAEGRGTNATGAYSHAEGNAEDVAPGPTAAGEASHAEGTTTTRMDAGAYALSSHIEGRDTKAEDTALAGHAEGINTTVGGWGSHAEGRGSKAMADASHAEGWWTRAEADYTHAEGYGTWAASSHQSVRGYNNVVDSEGEFVDIVGWGPFYNENSEGTKYDPRRKNVSSLTTSGDLHLAGDVYIQSDRTGHNGYKLPYTIVTEAGSGAKTLALAKRDHIYIYTGALTSLTVTAIENSNAITDIIFTSGASITVTLPTGVKLPSGFTFEANKTYEINILNNLALVGTWE